MYNIHHSVYTKDEKLFMRVFGKTLSITDISIFIVVIGISAGIIVGVAESIKSTERDKIRLADAQSIMNALEIYKTLYGSLPNTTERDCEDWDVGSSKSGSGNTFINELAVKGVLNPPVEKFGISSCSYRYQKFTNNGCGEQVSYALLGLKLEGTKNKYNVKDVIDPCYPDIYRWTSDPHWIAFMIRE